MRNHPPIVVVGFVLLHVLGWGIGRATLRGEEQIQLIRLAPTASMILIPTDRGESLYLSF